MSEIKRILEKVLYFIQMVFSAVWLILLFEILTIVTALGSVVGLLGYFVEPEFKKKIDGLMNRISDWCHDQISR